MKGSASVLVVAAFIGLNAPDALAAAAGTTPFAIRRRTTAWWASARHWVCRAGRGLFRWHTRRTSADRSRARCAMLPW